MYKEMGIGFACNLWLVCDANNLSLMRQLFHYHTYLFRRLAGDTRIYFIKD